jgi:hypothetical protein
MPLVASIDHATAREPIHYSTVFRYGATVLCASKSLCTPAAGDPRYVTCPACLALMTAAQRAQREEQVRRYG